MKYPLKNRFFSHESTGPRDLHRVADIRKMQARKVRRFEELVEAMARIAFHNAEYAIFFRGQASDHRNSVGETTFYPTFYRPSASARLDGKEIERRRQQLDASAAALVALFKKEKLQGAGTLARHPELVWSVLQHYEACPTPLLDVTHSLRVAASFATVGGREGFVYAVALPHPTGVLTHSAEEELLMVRLLGICPPEAKRPYYQEGHLLGSLPPIQPRKGPHHDGARRVIAKFQIVGKDFWSARFPAIPREALYPEDDLLRDRMAALVRP